MQCIDCHFEQDSHGNGKLYGETRNAVEIDCVDCHGSIQQRATLITSGVRPRPPEAPISPPSDALERASLLLEGTASTSDRCWTRARSGKSFRSLDTITPGNPHYSEKSRYAKTIQKDGQTWGDAPRRRIEPGALE